MKRLTKITEDGKIRTLKHSVAENLYTICRYLRNLVLCSWNVVRVKAEHGRAEYL